MPGFHLAYRPTHIQPSSTTLRYTIVAGGENRYIHSSCESRRVELEALDAIRGVVERGGRIVEMSEGSLWRPEPPLESIDFADGWMVSDVYMVVADPEIGCPLRCPWCYARPRPLEAPVRYTASLESLLERLAGSIERVVKRVVEACRGDMVVDISIVFGGSIDPLVRLDTGQFIADAFYWRLVEKLSEDMDAEIGSGMLTVETEECTVNVYNAISTSNLLGYLSAYEHLNKVYSEIAVTYLTRELFKMHPLWRSIARYTGATYRDYESMVEEAARKGATPVFIVHRVVGYAGERVPLPEVKAERYFILSLHPTDTRFMATASVAVPSPRDIYTVLDYLVVEKGVRLHKVGLDSCSMIRLGADPRLIHEFETRRMIRCTPGGCRYARICPRGGGGVCVAEMNAPRGGGA